MVHAQALSVGACGNTIPRLTCAIPNQCQANVKPMFKPTSRSIPVSTPSRSSSRRSSRCSSSSSKSSRSSRCCAWNEKEGRSEGQEQTKTRCTTKVANMLRSVSLLQRASLGLFLSLLWLLSLLLTTSLTRTISCFGSTYSENVGLLCLHVSATDYVPVWLRIKASFEGLRK